jgi:hypothetical protein
VDERLALVHQWMLRHAHDDTVEGCAGTAQSLAQRIVDDGHVLTPEDLLAQ